jgi:hypothetical protein
MAGMIVTNWTVIRYWPLLQLLAQCAYTYWYLKIAILFV